MCYDHLGLGKASAVLDFAVGSVRRNDMDFLFAVIHMHHIAHQLVVYESGLKLVPSFVIHSREVVWLAKGWPFEQHVHGFPVDGRSPRTPWWP